MSYFKQGGKLEGFNVKKLFLLVFLLTFGCVLHADGWLPESGEFGSTTKAPNVVTTEWSADGLRIGGIANTRHNLTMSYTNSAAMDNYRNNYYEVCVYCHTPHGANSTVAAPLWNRTVAQRTYSLFYNENRQSPLDLNVSQPGPNSLTCLSCHDGATAIDSVINMPTQMIGEFRAGYNVAQETVVNNSFLDAWGDNLLNAGSPANAGVQGGGHAALGGAPTAAGSCMACHNATNSPQQGSPSFESFTIGGYSAFTQGDTGLTDDHPIGVKYPEKFGADVDYNEPVKLPKIAFFDRNSNGYPDTNEVRLYDSGDGYEVECGSCHDPHGIKVSGAQNDELIPSFLRMGRIDIDVESPANSSRSLVSANHASSLCLTCHVK